MKTMATLLAVSVLFAGCATQSHNIPATPQSSIIYKHLTCDELNKEEASVLTDIKHAASRQDQKASIDTVNAALSFIIPLYFISAMVVGGNDTDATELSILKGQADALAHAKHTANCK